MIECISSGNSEIREDKKEPGGIAAYPTSLPELCYYAAIKGWIRGLLTLLKVYQRSCPVSGTISISLLRYKWVLSVLWWYKVE